MTFEIRKKNPRQSDMKLKRIVPPMLCKDVPTAGTRSASSPSTPKILTQATSLKYLTWGHKFLGSTPLQIIVVQTVNDVTFEKMLCKLRAPAKQSYWHDICNNIYYCSNIYSVPAFFLLARMSIDSLIVDLPWCEVCSFAQARNDNDHQCSVLDHHVVIQVIITQRDGQ